MLRLVMACAVALSASCATYDTPCCVHADDGGCKARADLPPGSVLATRFVEFGAAGCQKQVCVSDPSVKGAEVELQGYCTVQCNATTSCPGSKLGPMECQQLSSDDGGVSICVRRTDAGSI